jgi:hypothetical protein
MRESIRPLILALDVVKQLVARLTVVVSGVLRAYVQPLVVECFLDSLVLIFALCVQLAHQVSDLDSSVVSQQLHFVIPRHILLLLVSDIVRLLQISHVVRLLRLASRMRPDYIRDHKDRARLLGRVGSG